MDSNKKNAFVFKLTGIIILAILAMAALNHTRQRPVSSTVPAVDTSVSPMPFTEIRTDVPINTVADRAKARVNQLSKVSLFAKVSTKPSEKIRRAAEDSISRLKRIRECEKNPTLACPVASAELKREAELEPSGYSNKLADETIAALAFLKALAEAEAREHRRPTFSVEAVSRAYVRHRDDNVREQALALASLIVDSEPQAVVEIASRALSATVSGALAEQALDLMYATRGANPALVDQTLVRTLSVGGWDVRDAIAGRILPFISAENRQAIVKVLERAPNRSKLALHLKLGIEEFDRMERL